MTLEIKSTNNEHFRILSLDGGGAKGFYTLGVLKELEALLGKPLCEQFKLIFGTSTGAIIAALLALGYEVNKIHDLYKEYVPTIMRCRTAKSKSKALAHLADTIFGDKKFTDVKTGVGIVATNWDLEKPMIFKGSISQAHGRHGSFIPGFGCTISEAVQASCSAYPFFKRPIITTGKGDRVELMDGGFCANNPTLYAIADAIMALNKKHADIRVLSVGVGNYPEPKGWRQWIFKIFMPVRLLQKTLNVNTLSMEQLRLVLFKDIATVRINETYEKPEMATDLLEHDMNKLNMLHQRGCESFAKYEAELKALLL